MRWRVMLGTVALVAAVACTDSTSDRGATSTSGSTGEVTTTSSSTGETTTTTLPGGGFSSDGAVRDGWYWLEQPGDTARWEFTDLTAGVLAAPLDVRMVAAADALSTDGFGSLEIRVGSGDIEFGTVEAQLPGSPVADHPELALLRGAVGLDALDLTDELPSLWVEVATESGEGLAVLPESVSLGTAASVVTPVGSGAASAATPPALTRIEGRFTSNGDEIAGWWWVRDAAFTQVARWEFPTVPGIEDGVTMQWHVLATDGVDGGPGFDAEFYLTWGVVDADGHPLGGGIEPEPGEKLRAPTPPPPTDTTVRLTIPNTSPPGDTLGYRAQDVVEIEAVDVPDGAVGIWFEATRVDPTGEGAPTTRHVAFNAPSLGLLVPATDGGGDEGTTEDDLEGDGGGLQGDGTITDPDDQADADSMQDADDVGDLSSGTYAGSLDGETEDWFAFQLDQTQIVDITVEPTDGLFVDIDLFDQYLNRRAPHPSQETDLAFSYAAGAGEGGRFYLHLTRLHGSGPYTFTITVRDADDANRHADAGDTAATALTVGDGDVVGEVTRSDSADRYLVEVPAGESLTATLVTLSDQDLELELLDVDGASIDADMSYPGEPAPLFLDAGGARTVALRVARPGGDVGGRYRLRVRLGGVGECEGTWVYASGFVSSGSDSGRLVGEVPGWYWLQPTIEAARSQQSTWAFDQLPDDGVVRIFFDMPIDDSMPLSAGAYVVVGSTSNDGSSSVGAPRYVSFRAVQGESLTGANAMGEIAVPHALLAGGDQWWIRLTLSDPSDPTGRALAPVGVANAITNVTVCAAGDIDELPGLDGPVQPEEAQVTLDPTSHVLTSNIGMFVDPGGDIDGDGLNQTWEDAAMLLANPVLQLDEEELWLHWTELLTANFVQVTPWPSYANPQYIVIGYLNTWAYDPGGGTLQATDLVVFENHRGDSERIWQAWKVLNDEQVQLEWVNTSAHMSYTDHSGVWRVGEQQCNVGYVAQAELDVFDEASGPVLSGWGYYEVMCDELQFDASGRLVISTSQNKHAMYPSDETCNDAALAALGETNQVVASEECGWDTIDDPFGIWWDDDDFADVAGSLGGGRWQFPVFNVGEPGYPLIDDLDEPSTWLGVDSEQVVALTGEYLGEAVWSGHNPDGSNFCGGLEAGTELSLHWWANDIEVPERCSSVLGGKFAEWQRILLDAMASRYRVTLHTGTEFGAGTDEAVTIQLRDADGTLLAQRLVYGDLEGGAADVAYLVAESAGGPVSSVSLRRTGDDVETADCYVTTVTVDDLVTGESVTFTADEWVEQGAGVTLTG